MTGKIEPALSAEEWAEALAETEPSWSVEERVRYAVAEAGLAETEELIAFANHVLDPGDQRKITREMINALKVIFAGWEGMGQDPVALEEWIKAPDDRPEPPLEYFGDRIDGNAIIDALESYLPPE